MISRYLDSEAAAQHYLTRRATLEDVLNFEGDQQDLLSLYLTNGFWFGDEILDTRVLRFFKPTHLFVSPRHRGDNLSSSALDWIVGTARALSRLVRDAMTMNNCAVALQ